MSDRWQGVFTALVTPFDAESRLDEVAYRRLADRQVAAGISGLVPCGTTGETPTLSSDEWETCIKTAVEAAAGKVPVIAGTGTNDTLTSIQRTQRAKELGADAALVVTPYYNKPNPEGLRRHYASIAQDGGLPVVVYNVPSRTGLNMKPEQVFDVAKIDGILAVKEAAGDMSQALDLLAGRPASLRVLSGEDDLTCGMMLMGGDGVVSVVSNVAPEMTVAMARAALAGDAETARRHHMQLLPLIRTLFSETNPVPAKAALAQMGLCEPHVRPPLYVASEATRKRVSADLDQLGLHSGARS